MESGRHGETETSLVRPAPSETVYGLDAHSDDREKESKREMAARQREKYQEEIKQALQKELNLENPMAVPKLEKIVLNMGVGEATADSKKVTAALADLSKIAGQKPAMTRSRKSIASTPCWESPLMKSGALPVLVTRTSWGALTVPTSWGA